jgi:RNA polymerase sigma-70 factor, ECF subfamily
VSGAPPLFELVERACAAWPGIDFDREALAAYLGRRADLTHLEDLALAWACARAEPAALRLFDVHIVERAVTAAAARRNLSEATLDEVKQLVRQRLLLGEPGRLPRIAEYGGEAPLTTWAKVVALRLALNHLRAEHREAERAPKALPELMSTHEPDLALLKRRWGPRLNEAVTGAFESLDPHAKRLLRLHCLESVTLPALARLTGLGRSTVALHVAQAKAQVLDETRRRLGAQLPSEALDSLLELAGDALDVSLSRVLASANGNRLDGPGAAVS